FFDKYYVNGILSAVIVQPILSFGREATRWLEGGALDGGRRGVAFLLRGISGGLRRLQTGYMRNYALAILIGVVLIILYYAVRGQSACFQSYQLSRFCLCWEVLPSSSSLVNG